MLAVAAAGVEPGGELVLLQSRPRVVPEDDVLRPLPRRPPQRAAQILAAQAGPLVDRAHVDELPHALLLEGQLRVEAGVDGDEVELGREVDVGQGLEVADAVGGEALRELPQRVGGGLAALVAVRGEQHLGGVVVVEEGDVVVAEDAAGLELDGAADDADGVVALVDEVAEQEEDVAAGGVVLALVDERIEFAKAAVNVTDDNQSATFFDWR